MYRALILGVPRSGKSRLAKALADRLALNHYAIDGLVSALGEAYPRLGVGRQHEETASAAALEPFLSRWIRHLDYEGDGYVLEGYAVTVSAAATLAEQGLRVAALGCRSVDAGRKCRVIRAYAAKSEWTQALSDTDLRDLVNRYVDESATLEAACRDAGLPYFETGLASDDELAPVLEHFTRDL